MKNISKILTIFALVAVFSGFSAYCATAVKNSTTQKPVSAQKATTQKPVSAQKTTNQKPVQGTKAPAKKAQEKAPEFVLNNVVFKNNTLISTKILQEAVKDKIGQKFSKKTLSEISIPVTKLYQDKGYATSYAYFPPQTVDKGEIIVEIVEAKYGNITLNFINNSNKNGEETEKQKEIHSYVNKMLNKNNIKKGNVLVKKNLENFLQQTGNYKNAQFGLRVEDNKESNKISDLIVFIKEK